MPDQTLAYHTVASAMRDRSRADARQRFSMAIKAALIGHVPHIQYRLAARERRAVGWSEDTVSRAVFDWLQTDLNPAVQAIRATRSPAAIVELYNAYNAAVPLGVKTTVEGEGARRDAAASVADDELCAAGSLAVLAWVRRDTAAKAARPSQDWMLSGWRAAIYLGAERLAGAEAAHALESEGDMDLRRLSMRLGSTARTLQRRIAEEGLTITQLRLASRQTRALRLIQAGGMSLGQVAIEAGYADQAHMSRGFKFSCGLTPGQIAQALAA